MKPSAHEWKLAGPVLSVLLMLSFLSPLVSAVTPFPRLSGSETIPALIAWLLVIVGSGRLYAIDAVISLLFGWSFISAIANDVTLVSAVLLPSLLVCPFIAARLIVSSGLKSRETIRNVLTFLVLAQVAMFVPQLATYSGYDDLAGTFVDTLYGSHVASFVVLLGAAAYVMSDARGWRGNLALAAAFILAILADSKVALVYMIAVSVTYIFIGRPLRLVRFNTRLATRTIGAFLAAATAAAVFTGYFGTIRAADYVQQTVESDGGKLAVARVILNPSSELWQRENILIGAGPAQTVSRTAGFTVANSRDSGSRGGGLGMEEARYLPIMEELAQGSGGFIASSSFTNPKSSILGLIGDLGIVGAAVYFWGFWWVYRRIASASTWRSWPALAWLGLLLPGLIGEWLEMPPAMMGAAAILLLLASSRRSTSGSAVLANLPPHVPPQQGQFPLRSRVK